MRVPTTNLCANELAFKFMQIAVTSAVCRLLRHVDWFPMAIDSGIRRTTLTGVCTRHIIRHSFRRREP